MVSFLPLVEHRRKFLHHLAHFDVNRPSHRSGDNSEHGMDTIWQVCSEGESGASIAVAEFMGRVGK